MTAWLIFMIIVNALAALLHLFGGQPIREGMPNTPDWAFPVLGLVCLVNFVCAIALFKWKKWGFFGFVGTSVLAAVINLAIGPGVVPALMSLVGIGILYGVLHIGKEESKGWPQLE